MCHFSSYWGGGRSCHPGQNIVFLRHESEAQSLSAHCNKKVGTIHFQYDCVSRSHTAISQIFIFTSYISELFQYCY